VPIPVSERSVTLAEALLVTAAVALKVPAALGLNVTLIVALCPASTVTGRLGEVSVKYWVEIVTLLIVTDTLPVLVTIKVIVLLVSSGTSPKLMVWLPKERLPGDGWVDAVLVMPEQPTRAVKPRSIARVAAAAPNSNAELLSGERCRIFPPAGDRIGEVTKCEKVRLGSPFDYKQICVWFGTERFRHMFIVAFSDVA